MTLRVVQDEDGREYIELSDVEFRVPLAGPLMTIPDLDIDYQWPPVVVAGGERTTSTPEPVDIVDRIDELVNDQLANYHQRSGYDHNVNQDLCPHCGREWHGLKITARIEQMRARGWYDETYSYADDDTEVLCEGSEFIGPMKYPPVWALNGVISGIQSDIVAFFASGFAFNPPEFGVNEIAPWVVVCE